MPEDKTAAASAANQQPDATPAAGQGAGQPDASATPASFDEWLKGQDEAVKGLVTERFKQLETTVKATRTEREALNKQLRDATKKLEEGSEARKALEDVSAKLEGAEQRAAFYEDAARPEIGCNNPKLAWLAAIEAGAIDGKGRISWDTLKSQFPELFKAKVPNANAGTGTGTPPAGRSTMNDFIRRAAGKSP
jgi:hypothetical protein